MRRKHILISPVLDRTIQAQVEMGRYKDYSAAVQDAAWNYFIGSGNPFEEYGVTPGQVESSFKKTVRRIEAERKSGKLKLWRPKSSNSRRSSAPTKN